jgi:NAD(P)-dependent dehydrogenase (short-subunit alcohol dehydrogenase family)
VTGATAGIGKVTALEIARRGTLTVIVGRNEAKTQDVVDMIRRETGEQRVDYLLADQSSIQATKELSQQFKARYDRLDILVNNVGAIFMSRGETVDGFENTWALNHLVGYFFLTNLLLDVIEASAPARIVNVSSGAHFQGKINFADLEGKEKYSGFGAYSQSKLANVMFTYELARRLQDSGVTVNALHPGVVASNFGVTNNGGSPIYRIGRKFFNLFSISEAKGAETSIYLATSPEVEGVTGQYFEKKQPRRSSEASYDMASQQRLWEISQQMLTMGSQLNEKTLAGHSPALAPVAVKDN